MTTPWDLKAALDHLERVTLDYDERVVEQAELGVDVRGEITQLRHDLTGNEARLFDELEQAVVRRAIRALELIGERMSAIPPTPPSSPDLYLVITDAERRTIRDVQRVLRSRKRSDSGYVNTLIATVVSAPGVTLACDAEAELRSALDDGRAVVVTGSKIWGSTEVARAIAARIDGVLVPTAEAGTVLRAGRTLPERPVVLAVSATSNDAARWLEELGAHDLIHSAAFVEVPRQFDSTPSELVVMEWSLGGAFRPFRTELDARDRVLMSDAG